MHNNFLFDVEIRISHGFREKSEKLTINCHTFVSALVVEVQPSRGEKFFLRTTAPYITIFQLLKHRCRYLLRFTPIFLAYFPKLRYSLWKMKF